MVTTSCASGSEMDTGIEVNVGDLERAICAAAGGIALLHGLSRVSRSTVVALVAGGALLYRGLTGHCSVYEAIGMSTVPCREKNKLGEQETAQCHEVTDASLAATGESPSFAERTPLETNAYLRRMQYGH